MNYTTNVHEAGRVSPRRVRLTATASGDLVWCELYLADGTLQGCGPSFVMLDAHLRDAAESRLASAPDGCPMYWRTER